MVAISPPAKVLVTGANGFLATWVVKKYLEAGYSVRGTVRSLSKSAFLKDKFAQYGDRFELVVVDDITEEGAFNEAVKGVDAIAHTASPTHLSLTHPDEIITPAVQGTTSVLNSALKYGGSKLKRVILTSSTVAIFEVGAAPRVYTESDWNNAAVEVVKTNGIAAKPFLIYCASKVLTEKAAWEFVSGHKSKISWDLVVINPPWMFGPSLTPAPTVDDINASQRVIYDILSGAQTGAELQNTGNWVYVGVAAEAHVRATHAVAAGGHRIIVTSGTFVYQDLLDAAAELGLPNVPRGEPGSGKGVSFAELGIPNVPRREPGSGKGVSFTVSFDSKKSEELLGLNPRTPLKDLVAESVEDFKARGYPGFKA